MSGVPFERVPGRNFAGRAVEMAANDWRAIRKELKRLQQIVDEIEPPEAEFEGITVEDEHGNSFSGIDTIVHAESTVTNPSPGTARVDIDNTDVLSEQTIYSFIPLMAQSGQADTEYPRISAVEVDLSVWSESKISAVVVNRSDPIRLIAEYFDGDSWEPLGPDFDVTPPTDSFSELPAEASDWESIPPLAKIAPVSVRVRPLLASDDSSVEGEGGDGSFDYPNITLILRGTIAALQGETGEQGPQGDTGATGETGAAGADGADGIGVPAGGTTDQVLAKVDGTDYNTYWATVTGGGGGNIDDGTVDGQAVYWVPTAGKWQGTPYLRSLFGPNPIVYGVGSGSNSQWVMLDSDGQTRMGHFSSGGNAYMGFAGTLPFCLNNVTSTINMLTVDMVLGDMRIAGSLGVGNSFPATTLGSVVGAVEIFDADGVSLGYLPIYDSIS